MCTIMSFAKAKYTPEVRAQIVTDSVRNDDGWSLVLAKEGEFTQILRTSNLDDALRQLDLAEWDRFWLHSRLATGWKKGVSYTHCWTSHSGRWVWMHNGFIQAKGSSTYPVDSQAIGVWLDTGGMDLAKAMLKNERYANVFILDTDERKWTVWRSEVGVLWTDGEGNYSSSQVSGLMVETPKDSTVTYELPNKKKYVQPHHTFYLEDNSYRRKWVYGCK